MKRRGRLSGCLTGVICIALLGAVIVTALRYMGIDVLKKAMIPEEYSRYVHERAEEAIPYFEQRYFLAALDDKSLDAAVTVYECAMDFESRCRFDSGVDMDDFSTVLAVLGCECPELMQLDLTDASVYTYDRLTEKVTSFEPPYCMDESEYVRAAEACRGAVEELLDGTEGMSDIELEKYVFDRIAAFCHYEVDARYSATAYGALVEGEAKCDGISAAFKWVMEEAGLRCVTVTADIPGHSVGHAWNALELDGEWYRVDLTQSVRNDESDELPFPEPVYYAFNISDSIPKTGYIVSENLLRAAPLPECRNMDKSIYALRGQLVREGEDGAERLSSAIRQTCESGGGPVILQFENSRDFEELDGDMREIISDVLDSQPGVYSIKYVSSTEYNLFAASVVAK